MQALLLSLIHKLCTSQMETSTPPPRAYPGHLMSFPALQLAQTAFKGGLNSDP